MMTNTAAPAAAPVCAKNPFSNGVQRQDHHPVSNVVTELQNGCPDWGRYDPIRIPCDFPSSTRIALDEDIDMEEGRPGAWDDPSMWEWDFGWEGSVRGLWAAVGLRQNPFSDSGE
jgi:hypothetical protein